MTETEAKWAERVQAWRADGGTAADFARGKGYEASTLQMWARKIRRGRISSALVESPTANIRMLRVTSPSQEALRSTLTVLVGAVRIEVRAGFEAALLRAVVDALGVAR